MSAQVARIVSSSSLLNQTSLISSQTVFTPDEDGLYRVNAYLASNPGAGSTNIQFSLTFTDDQGNSAFTQPEVPVTPGQGFTAAIRLKASQPVAVSVQALNGPADNPDFNFYLTVEQL